MSVMVGIFSRMYYSNMKVWDSVCVCVCVCVCIPVVSGK